MKLRITPTDISLKDIPPEGREFTYTRESGELTSVLTELIDGNFYRIHFKITPMGNTYDLRGEAKTGLDLQCALCAMDLKFPVNLKLHELLIVQKAKPMHKGDQQTKANHAHEWVEGGPDYILLDDEVFRVGEYIHEVIALAEPIRPMGQSGCEDLNCENLTDGMKKWLNTGALTPDPIRANPFSVLEKIKLKS